MAPEPTRIPWHQVSAQHLERYHAPHALTHSMHAATSLVLSRTSDTLSRFLPQVLLTQRNLGLCGLCTIVVV